MICQNLVSQLATPASFGPARRLGYTLRLITLFMAGLLVFINAPFFALAQAPLDAEVEFYIEGGQPNQTYTVGDQIKFRLEIRHPADSRVVLPQVEEQWGSFTVVDQTAPQTVDQADGTAITSRDFVVAIFQPGDYQTPPLVVTHRKPDGSIEELATPIIPVTIVTVLTAEDIELRDLKPQVDLPLPVWWPWLVAGLLAAMLIIGLLGGLALWLYHRRRSQIGPSLAPAPVFDRRPPEVIAYAELDRIQRLDLPAQNQIKEHYALVAACLRRYIEGRYRIAALEQTTTELGQAFRAAKIPTSDSTGLLHLVTESDYVKFARYRPYDKDIQMLIDKAREVIEITTTKAAPVEAKTPLLPPPPPEMKEVQV